MICKCIKQYDGHPYENPMIETIRYVGDIYNYDVEYTYHFNQVEKWYRVYKTEDFGTLHNEKQFKTLYLDLSDYRDNQINELLN